MERAEVFRAERDLSEHRRIIRTARHLSPRPVLVRAVFRTEQITRGGRRDRPVSGHTGRGLRFGCAAAFPRGGGLLQWHFGAVAAPLKRASWFPADSDQRADRGLAIRARARDEC